MPVDDRARRAATASLEESAAVACTLADALVDQLVTAAGLVADALRSGGKVVLFGNGGSAADAQHLAAELVGRYEIDRLALPAIALTTDTSVLTALANDLGVETIFARQVEALVREEDVVIALSTSGVSANVIAGVRAARERGARTIAFTRRDDGGLAAECDLALAVDSERTARIQEAHITLGHVLCELVESALAEA